MAINSSDEEKPEIEVLEAPKSEEAKEEYEDLSRSEEAEPWEPKLVLYSIGIGIVVLIIGGWLVTLARNR
jgi:hypothetical protein